MTTDNVFLKQSFPSFRFVVEIDGKAQAAFTECSLPSIEREVEEVKEGGLNGYVHQLPGMVKSVKVTLKNGIGKTDLMDWYLKTVSGDFKRKAVTITLKNSMKEAVMAWRLDDALPIKWAGPQLKSDENTIAIQALDFICGEFSISYG